MFIDLTTGQAVPQAELVYTNRFGQRVVVRGCGTSATKGPISLTETSSNCPMRHDFPAKVSHEMVSWQYQLNGVTYQATPCVDNDNKYSHEKVYTDQSGVDVCPPAMRDGKPIARQSRIQIVVNGVPQYISDCAPDPDQSIFETTEGCAPANFQHDVQAGVSYGQVRYYYVNSVGKQVPVTQCQSSDVTYRHDVTTPVGYQHDDAKLQSLPASRVTIKVNGQTYTVADAVVLPGAVAEGYIDTGESTAVAFGNPVYEGCNKTQPTVLTKKWKRPDGSFFEQQTTTPGKPIGPVNVCVVDATPLESREMKTGEECQQVKSNGNTTEHGGTPYDQYYLYDVYAIVEKRALVNKETGETSGTTCSFNGSWYGTKKYVKTISGFFIYAGGDAWKNNGLCNNYPGPGPFINEQTLFIPPCPF